MGRRKGLGEFEQLVLLVVLGLGDRAFAPDIAERLEESAGRHVTRGALYSALNRLEDKGLLVWEAEEPDEVRGGHIRRLFSVTETGREALQRRRKTLLGLWAQVEQELEGGGR